MLQLEKHRGVLALLIGVLLGGGIGAAGQEQRDAAQLESGLRTMQEQNAAIEKLSREVAGCRERFSGVTVVYGPESIDVTDAMPQTLKQAVQQLAVRSGLGRGARLLVMFPERSHSMLTIPAKLEPVAPAGNPYTFAWYTRQGQQGPPRPLAQHTRLADQVP